MTKLNRESPAPTDSVDEKQSKVGRLIYAYNLDGMPEELEARWTGTVETQQSLRELADYFNQRLLRVAMIDAGMDPLKGEIENAYRLLINNLSAGVRTQTRKRFEHEGLDVKQVKRDFVSHQAIHTYLTKYREVQKDEQTTDSNQIEKSERTVQQLKNRLIAVTDNTLNTLRSTGRIALGDFDVSGDVRVFCHDCGTQYSVSELLEAGRCDCDLETDS